MKAVEVLPGSPLPSILPPDALSTGILISEIVPGH